MSTSTETAGSGDVVVEAGDSISSIAAAAGHLADTIWQDPANEALRTAREDGELLVPGDRVTVMPVRPKKVACATGKRHVFRSLVGLTKVTIVVEDEEGSAFASKQYELTVGDQVVKGTTDDAGKMEVHVDPAERRAELKVWLDEPGLPSPWTHTIALGALLPKNHPRGIQQRLTNLGFYAGELTGELDAPTLAAVNAFQRSQQMTVTDSIDDATIDKLVEVHKT